MQNLGYNLLGIVVCIGLFLNFLEKFERFDEIDRIQVAASEEGLTIKRYLYFAKAENARKQAEEKALRKRILKNCIENYKHHKDVVSSIIDTCKNDIGALLLQLLCTRLQYTYKLLNNKKKGSLLFLISRNIK